MARRRSEAIAIAATAVLWSGCGGMMQPDELARSIGTLESSAAEGALLARDMAGDRTKATFARAHARELGEAVDHEAEGRSAVRALTRLGNRAGRLAEGL